MSSIPKHEDGNADKTTTGTTSSSSSSDANSPREGPVHPSSWSNDAAPNSSLNNQKPASMDSAVRAPTAVSDTATIRIVEGTSLSHLSGAPLPAVYPYVSLGHALPPSNVSYSMNEILLRDAINRSTLPSVEFPRYAQGTLYAPPNILLRERGISSAHPSLELSRYTQGTSNAQPPNYNAAFGLSNPLLSGHSQFLTDPRFTLPRPQFVLPNRNHLTDPNLLDNLSLRSHIFRQHELLYGPALSSSQLGNSPALPYSYQRAISSHASGLPSSASHPPATAASASADASSPAALSDTRAAESSAIGGNEGSTRQTSEILKIQGQIRKRNKRKYTHESFPSRLHRLLREANELGHDHICSFSSDGAMFQILNTKGFEEQVLPKYFRHGRIDSFKRLLRMYGWQRVEGTWMQGVFKHPMFRRDAPELCLHMERKEKKEAPRVP